MNGWGGNIIRGNTIADNSFGFFSQGTSASTINYNNFENNSDFNIKLYQKSDVNATFNWWGTTDAALISQKIFDNKNNFHSGTVTFVPFLTEPNPEAVPSSAPGSSAPSASSSTLEVPELLPWIIFAVALLVTSALIVAVRLKRKRSSNH